mgnify:CR=1 FL=1
MKRTMTAALFIIMSLVLGGCGESLPGLATVAGKVTVDGQPVDGATMTFMPDASNRDLTQGSATTDNQGAYRVKSGERDGLAPGKYKVVIFKRVSESKGSTGPGLSDIVQGKDVLPKSYGDASKTDLTIEVPPSGTTTANLTLSTKKK